MALTLSPLRNGLGPELISRLPAPPSHWSDEAVRTVHTLLDGASDPVLFGAMLGAQFTFGLSRLALARFLPTALSWGKTLTAANGVAFGLEGLAFVGSDHGLRHALGRPIAPDSDLSKELGHTYLTLGLLKGLSGITSSALQLGYRGIPRANLGWKDRLILTGAPQAAAFSGIYLSHTLAPSLGLADPMGQRERLEQSAFTLLNFAMVGSVLGRVPGYAKANHEIQRRTQMELQRRWENLSRLGSFGDASPLQEATLGPRSFPESIGEDLAKQNIFKMEEATAGQNRGKAGGKKSRPEKKAVESRIQLPAEKNGESFLQLAKHLVAEYPDVFGTIKIPQAEKIVTQYPKLLGEIELARINSPDRLKIAQSARDWVLDHFKYKHSDDTVTTLREAVKIFSEQPKSAELIEEVLPPDPTSGPGYRAIIRHNGVVYDTLEKILAWSEEQVNAGKISPSVAKKIKYSAEEAYSDKARVEGRYGYFRIPADPKTGSPLPVVLISGGAELAPLNFFVEAGAKVLVVDLFPLGKKVDTIQQAPGGLYQYQANLLTDIPQVAGAIQTFAGKEKVNLGFYPYADGLVWLLSSACEAIYGAVAPKVESTFTLRSPSVVAEIPTETGAISDQRWAAQTLRNVGNLFTKNLAGEKNQNRVAQTIVAEQKLPYAVGNWLGKTIFSEARLGDDIRHSTLAPVGPISFTGSMSANKMIVTALKAAHLFDVDVVPPHTSRDIQAFIYYDHFQDTKIDKSDFGWSLGAPPGPYVSGLMSDHADLGIFAQGNALSSMVYPAGIAGFAGVDSRKIIPEGLRKKQTGTYIAPDDPAQVQRILQGLKGPLAWAFADHLFQGAAVEQLYSGVNPAVRKSSDQWGMRLMDSWNQLPLLPSTRGKFSRSNQVFGKLLMTQIMRLKNPGDQIHLTVDSERRLASIRLHKPNGEGLEYRLTEQMPGDLKHIHFFEQIFHFGKPWNGQDSLKQTLRYDSKQGTLRSTSSLQINSAILEIPIHLGWVPKNDPALMNFRILFGHSPSQSLTYSVNLAVRRAFEQILEDAQSPNSRFMIDPLRTMVHSIRIQRTSSPAAMPEDFKITLTPEKIWEADQGQLLSSEIRISNESGKEQIRANLEALVYGNQTQQPFSDRRLVDRGLTQLERSFSETIQVMGKQDLEIYGQFFDPNVLHQRAIVGQAAGFPGTPNPGIELMAEIEGLIRSKTAHFERTEVQLESLNARFEKPLLQGQEYQFESGYVPEKEAWLFQVFEPGSRKVRVEGGYTLSKTLPDLAKDPAAQRQALWNNLVAYQSEHGFRPFPPAKDPGTFRKILLELAGELEQRATSFEYRGKVNLERMFSEIYSGLADTQRAERTYLGKNLDGSFYSRWAPRKKDLALIDSVQSLHNLVEDWNSLIL